MDPKKQELKRPARRKAAEPAKVVKVTIGLEEELYRRLKAYAGWNRKKVSRVVADALVPVLAGFVVSTRSQSPAAEGPRLVADADAA